MKSKKTPIIITICLAVIAIIGISTYFILNDKNKLTVDEKKWINDNLATVQNVNVINDINIFGKNGDGVFYDFLADFSSEYNLRVNPVISGSENTNAFKDTTTLTENSLVFTEDHYILVGKNKEVIDRKDISNLSLGYLNNNLTYINSFMTLTNGHGYDDLNTMLEAFKNGEITYLLIPR